MMHMKLNKSAIYQPMVQAAALALCIIALPYLHACQFPFVGRIKPLSFWRNTTLPIRGSFPMLSLEMVNSIPEIRHMTIRQASGSDFFLGFIGVLLPAESASVFGQQDMIHSSRACLDIASP